MAISPDNLVVANEEIVEFIRLYLQAGYIVAITCSPEQFKVETCTANAKVETITDYTVDGDTAS